MVRTVLGRIIVGWLVLLALLAVFGDVTVAATNGGRAAADFLTVTIGARPAALGGAYAASSSDDLAAWYNPAGLGFSETSEVSFGHVQWFQDVTMHHGGASFRLTESSTLAANILYVDYGTIAGFDGNGASTGDLEANDMAAAVSFGQRLNDNFSIGVTGKYVGQRLDDITASAFAADFGLRADFGDVSFGATVANVGTRMKFEEVEEVLPRSARGGIAVRLFQQQLMVTAEYENQFYGNAVVRNGAEFNIDHRYFIRAGYFTSPASESTLGNGLTFGAGALVGAFQIDYAYSGSEGLGSADLHRFSLSYFISR